MAKRKGPPRRRKNGEGTVYQRPDNYWAAQLTIGPKTRKTWVAKTEDEARAKLAEGIKRYQAGLPVTSSDRTLEHWIQSWLNDVKRPQVRLRTLDSYRSRLQHVVTRLGSLPLKSVSQMAIQRLYTDLSSQFKPATVHAIHVPLLGCLGDAVKLGLLEKNPCSGAVLPRIEEKEHNLLTPLDAARLVAAEKDIQLRALWALLVTTGMRFGEAAALSWSDVDFPDSRIDIRSTLTRPVGGGWAIGPPKTRTSRRSVYLGQAALVPLQEWRRTSQDRTIHRFVFYAVDSPIHHETIARALRLACRRIGAKRMSPHDLRHTAATNLLSNRVPVKVVSEMLGHSDVSLTMRLYQHVIPPMHREAMSMYDDLMGVKSSD